MRITKPFTWGVVAAGTGVLLSLAGACGSNSSSDGAAGGAGEAAAGNASVGGANGVGGVGGASGFGGSALAGSAGVGPGGNSGAGSGGSSAAGNGGNGGTDAAGAGGAAPEVPLLPCDIYAADGNACVGAHSTTRALFRSYSGKLYQVTRASDSTTTNIGTLSPGGYADAAAQDSFCANTTCVISVIYDQTSYANHLNVSKAGAAGGADVGANAAALPAKAGGHRVYGVYVQPGVGYRILSAKGTARNGQPEGMYMVTSGKHVNGGCCFDYGNTEQPLANDTGNGHMDAVYFGTRCERAPCSGSGPWVAADLENGLYQGNGSNPGNKTTTFDLVTAMLKNDGQKLFALKTGNAQAGMLSTQYAGTLPTAPGYIPMKQEGGIVLGVGGDNSNRSAGDFYEGVMTFGYPTGTADAAVQANIVSVGYTPASRADVAPTSEMTAQSWKYTTTAPAASWNTAAFDASGWASGKGGFGTAGTPGAVIGSAWNESDIWLRRSFDASKLTAAQVKSLILSIHHDEAAEIFVNGVQAATVTGYSLGYEPVDIAAAAKKAVLPDATNVLAVHCHNTIGGQYIDVGIFFLTL